MSKVSAGNPYRSTGIMPLVFCVTACSVDFGLSVYVMGSMSAKTGVAPVMITASAVATKVNAGNIISSPNFTPAAKRAAWRAAVPVFTAMACLTPANSA